MITEDTPYKLAEIIRDTWPQLYRPLHESDQSGTIGTPSNKQNDRESNC